MKFDPTSLDLDGAKDAVLREARRDEIPDVIRHADFEVRWPEVKKEIETQLADGTYQPAPAILVEVPKSALATRPIAVLDIRDRIVFEAVMQRLSPAIDDELFEEVHSARVVETKAGWWRPLGQIDAWVKFQRSGRELFEEYDHACMLTTDITSYFEFIDIDLLIEQLNRVHSIDKESVKLLAVLLRGLSRTTNLHGVPQGPEVSSVLGNLYLLPLDAVLRKMDVKFLRFQDDIKVFADEVHLLRIAVRDLMPVVRERHLNLSTGKTKILEGNAVLDHFEDSRKDAISYGLEVGGADVLDDLIDLFDEAVAGEAVVERDVRFAVTRFRRLESDHAVDWVLDNLARVPYLASILVGYLSRFAKDRPDIEDRVRAFLKNPAENIDPYVEMQLIRMLANAESIDDESYELMWSILKDQNKESFVRQFAARCVARHATGDRATDVELLRSLFKLSKDDQPLRRALLVAEVEARGPNKKWLKEVASADPGLASTCDYLKGGPQMPRP